MDEKIYTLVSSGLLAVAVLLLLLILGRLARLERVLTPRAGADTAPASAADEPSDPSTQQAEAEEPKEAQQTETEDEPFEKDGRWWFRREGQLLVYDEQSESWVDPEAQAPREPEPHVLDEAKGWDTAAAAATAAPIPEPVSPPEPIAVTPSEEERAPEPFAATGAPGAQQEAAPDPTLPEHTFVQPEPVNDATPDTTEADQSAGAQPSNESAPTDSAGQATHWKCPACGVINGSTATSCRMCFAARP